MQKMRGKGGLELFVKNSLLGIIKFNRRRVLKIGFHFLNSASRARFMVYLFQFSLLSNFHEIQNAKYYNFINYDVF
jgi:hypothetical protein